MFGEPALELTDLLRTDLGGRGIINVLAADQLVLKPRLFSSFLLWLLSELFENLPEVGDLDKPKLVFMFDEAHLLFDDAPPALRERVEQVVRIIRSKGVGVYFCSQFPDDVPGEILGQLGNRVQHALRAFTPRDQKAVRTAAETFVANPRLDVAQVISTLAVGEALVSTLQEGGVPMPVQRTMMAPPRSRIGAITAEERAAVRCAQPDRREVRHSGQSRVGVRDVEGQWCNGCDGCNGCTGATGATVRRVRAQVRRGTSAQVRMRRPRLTSFSGARSGGRAWSRRWPSRRPGRWGVSSADRFCAASSEGFSDRSARDEADSRVRRLAELGHRSRHAPSAAVCAAMAWNPGGRPRARRAPVRVIEDCLNGRRTVWDDPFKPGRNGLAGIEQRIEVNSPLALVILMLGTNDFQSVHQHNASHSAQGIASLVRAIRRAPIEPDMPVPPILIVAPPPSETPAGTMAEKFADAREKSAGLELGVRGDCGRNELCVFRRRANHHRQQSRRRSSRCRSARDTRPRARRPGEEALMNYDELETDRLKLRMWRESDLDDYAELIGRPAGHASICRRASRSRAAEAWRSIAFFMGHWQMRGYGHWAVEEKATRPDDRPNRVSES